MSDFSKLRRPKRGESEDDLLEQMKNFDSSNASIHPQNVLKVGKREKEEKVIPERQLKRQHGDESKGNIGVILKSVVRERVTEYTPTNFEPRARLSQPFPLVLKCENSVSGDQNAKPGKKMSLFAQQMKKQGLPSADDQKNASSSGSANLLSSFNRDFGSQSVLLNSSTVLNSEERTAIHEGNVHILNSKSEEQLLEDREFLLKTLDPSLVEFLKKKKSHSSLGKSESKPISEPMVVEDTKQVERTSREPPKPMEVEGSETTKTDNKIVDIDLEEFKKFPHMDKIEEEKMEWMTDLNEARDRPVNPPTEFSARFDFSGKLLPYLSSDISVKEGLHHHGEEPDRPGYTLDEILTLARSTVPQQRIISLTTMARIIENFKKGRYDNCFGPETNLLNELIKADLVTLLRMGIDENNSAVTIETTVACLAELVDNQVEEIALDSQFFSSVFPGYVQPSLQVKSTATAEFQKDLPEMKDIQVVGADLMLGLLRMDLLDRLTYIIDVLRPSSPTTIVNLLRILIRLGRHSLESAAKIVQHKSLLAVIVKYFLPITSSLNSTTSNPYGTPVHHALKFLRVLMSWSRSHTMQLLEKFDLGKKILSYIALEPSDKNPSLPLQEALRLTIEACRVWIVCLRFGLETERFLEFYPIIMNHIKFLNTNISMKNVLPGTKFNYHHATAIIEVISAAICCVPNSMELYSSVDRKAIKGQELQWGHLSGVIDILEFSLKKWIHEVATSSEEVQHFALSLLSSNISLFGSYVEKYPLADDFEAVSFLQKLENLFAFVVDHLLDSVQVKHSLRSIISHSVIGNFKLIEGRKRDPENLPSLGSISFAGDVLGGLLESSPFTFLNAILHFLKNSIRAHTNLNVSKIVEFFKSEEIQMYLKNVIKAGFKKSSSNWFVRQELHFVRLIVEISHQIKGLDRSLIWRVSAILLSHYQVGDEFFIHRILREIIFNSEYIDPTDNIIWKLKHSHLNQDENEILSFDEALPRLLQLYTKLILSNESALERSAQINNKLCYSISTLTVSTCGETCLPADWVYLPLLTVFSRRMQLSTDGGMGDLAKSEKEEINYVQLCLMWVYIMTVSSKVDQHLTVVSAALRLTRLATLFLATPDLFLDPVIHTLAKVCLDDIFDGFSAVKFEDPIPGIESFADFYSQLVEQFQAVSYGDTLFSVFLMIPLTNVNNLRYRIILWNDHPETLRNITIRLEDLPKSIGLSSFIEKPVDPSTSADIYRAYVKALLTHSVTHARNPLLYDIAVSNAQQACRTNASLRNEILSQFKIQKRQDLISKVVPDCEEV